MPTFTLDGLRAKKQFSYMKISPSCVYKLFQSTSIFGFLALVIIMLYI